MLAVDRSADWLQMGTGKVAALTGFRVLLVTASEAPRACWERDCQEAPTFERTCVGVSPMRVTTTGNTGPRVRRSEGLAEYF